MISTSTVLQILAGVPAHHARYLLEQAVHHPRKWQDIARAAIRQLELRAKAAPATTLAEPVLTTAGEPIEAMTVANAAAIAVDMAIENESPEYLEQGEDRG